MDVGIMPSWRITANGDDITETIKKHLRYIRYTDETGLESDVLEIALNDTDVDNPIAIPPVEAELELYLGYDGNSVRVGLFVLNKVSLALNPGTMTLFANAAPFDASTAGKVNLQSQKTRSWDAGKKLGDVVAKIAKEHGMESVVASSLSSVVLPHLDQSDESDIHFLLRVAKRYDGLVKPAGGKIIVAKRGESASATGQTLPTVTLERANVSDATVDIEQRNKPGTVVTSFHENRKAKRKIVKVGSGEPVTRLRIQFSTEAMATAAAKAEAERRERGKITLTTQCAGSTDLQAEAKLTMGASFRAGIAGDWIITRVEHSIDNNGGWVCSVSADSPSNTDAPEVEVEEE